MTIAKAEFNLTVETEIDLPGQAGIEQDVMDTQIQQKSELLDDIENRAHILEGSLAMAMDVADERHAGAFSGMIEQASMILKSLGKLRS